MSFLEKAIVCPDCGTSFTLTLQEQERFAVRGQSNDSKRCSWCRAARKIQLSKNATGTSSYGYSSQKQMYPATCAQCGKQTQVPFQPRGGKPVYCSNCYNKVRVSGY